MSVAFKEKRGGAVEDCVSLKLENQSGDGIHSLPKIDSLSSKLYKYREERETILGRGMNNVLRGR